MSAKELATHLNMSLTWIYRDGVRSGLIPYKFGTGRNAKIQFKASEVQAWIGQQRVSNAN
ncbi:helix-turn-helix transcriptional regulator [Streptomyces sp. NPDC002104]